MSMVCGCHPIFSSESAPNSGSRCAFSTLCLMIRVMKYIQGHFTCHFYALIPAYYFARALQHTCIVRSLRFLVIKHESGIYRLAHTMPGLPLIPSLRQHTSMGHPDAVCNTSSTAPREAPRSGAAAGDGGPGPGGDSEARASAGLRPHSCAEAHCRCACA